MTALNEDRYSMLLNNPSTGKYLSLPMDPGEYDTEMAWHNADINAIGLTEVMDYDYPDRKAVQFYILAEYVTLHSKDKMKTLEECMGKDFEKLSPEEIAEIQHFYDSTDIDECNWEDPVQLCRFVLGIAHNVESRYGCGRYSNSLKMMKNMGEFFDCVILDLYEDEKHVRSLSEYVQKL